jgi:hypothetical protein
MLVDCDEVMGEETCTTGQATEFGEFDQVGAGSSFLGNESETKPPSREFMTSNKSDPKGLNKNSSTVVLGFSQIVGAAFLLRTSFTALFEGLEIWDSSGERQLTWPNLR